MTTLSAVVATRDRPALVADCLATLISQREPPPGFEIVVIDDGSTTDIAAAVADVVDGAPVPTRVVRQAPSGLAVARNHGADVASGELLAYIDDDALVDPGWAAALTRCHERLGYDGYAGRITLDLPAPAPRWLTVPHRRYLAELDLGTDDRELDASEPGPFGANCAVPRAVFDRVGGFRADLGRTGTSLLSNEETDFFHRVRTDGGRIAYCGRATVVHRVAPERLTVAWFRRRVRAQGTSDMLMALEHGAPPSRRRELVRALRAGPILAKGIASGAGATGARLWLEYCGGRLAARSR